MTGNPELHVNIDHVVTLRQARRTYEPSPIEAVKILEKTGCAGITMHLREDRRHVQDSDIYEVDSFLRESAVKREVNFSGLKMNLPKLSLTFEMGATEEIRSICLKTKSKLATIVPEKRLEITTEGGMDLSTQKEFLKEFIKPIKDNGTQISFFIDPILEQLEMAKEIGAEFIELHTGTFANNFIRDFHDELKSRKFSGDYSKLSAQTKNEIKRLQEAARYAESLGLKVNLGHGLTVENLPLLISGHENAYESGIPQARELHIGHSLISNAIFNGIKAEAEKFIEIIKSKALIK